MELTGWAFTDARNTVACPKLTCRATVEVHCHTPKGRKATYPHSERMKAYIDAIGLEEFKRRHGSGR